MIVDHQAKWFFVEEDPNYRIKSTTRRHALEGSDLNTEARLVREAIQNSVDATLPDQKTDVLIWSQTITGAEVSNFRDLIGFTHPDSPFIRLSRLGLQTGNAYSRLDSAQADPPSSIPITIIEDRNTCGLGYDRQDEKDRFDELCLSFGQDSTGASRSRGGSYGFGKEVYEEASDCNTFFVYSVFEPSDETEGHCARFFGCATFDGHFGDDDTKYTGRALFGIHRNNERNQTECLPLVDDVAHQVASDIGFVRREDNDIGTSIMIVGSHIRMNSVRSAIEDYWWPRLHSNQLSTELWQDNDPLDPPEPNARPDLAPFIRCYSLIEEGVPRKDGEELPRLNATLGAKPGALALKAIELADLTRDEESEDPEGDSHLKNSVALIRSGPRMVVQYLNPGGTGTGRFAGVFVSDPQSEEALHLSEPPSHDSWNPNSQRLLDAYPQDEDQRVRSKKIVESILNRIRDRARRFQRGLDDTPLPDPVGGTRRLAQLLASVMSAAGSGRPPRPPPNRDPFEVRIRDGRLNRSKHSALTATIEVGLRQDAPIDSAFALLSLSPALVIDDNMRRESAAFLQLAQVSVNGTAVDVTPGQDVELQISKTEIAVIEAQTAEFDRDLYASLDVNVHLPFSADEDIEPESTGSAA